MENELFRGIRPVVLSTNPRNPFESGRRGSNPRPSAWEADALPLSYSRVGAVLPIGVVVFYVISSPNNHSHTAWEAGTLPLS